MTSDEPGPGQKYALKARRHIATLRAKGPNVEVEIRWCPSHQSIEGNEIVDEWAKLAADEPDAHGVEWFSTTNGQRESSRSRGPSPTSSEGSPKGQMAGRQRPGQEEVCPHQQPQIPTKRKAETGPHGGQSQQAPRLPVLPAEDGTLPHQAIPRVDDPPPSGGVSTASRLGSTSSRTAPNGRANRRLSGRPSSRRPASSPAPPRAGTIPTSRSCSPTSGTARWCSISLRQGDAASEASEWEVRERAERDWERMEEEDRLGAEF